MWMIQLQLGFLCLAIILLIFTLWKKSTTITSKSNQNPQEQILVNQEETNILQKTENNNEMMNQSLQSFEKQEITDELTEKIILEPNQYFYAKNGQVFKDIDELQKGLMKMTFETFRYHANEQKNDFANWIQYCFKNEELAQKIVNAITIDETVKAIKNVK